MLSSQLIQSMLAKPQMPKKSPCFITSSAANPAARPRAVSPAASAYMQLDHMQLHGADTLLTLAHAYN